MIGDVAKCTTHNTEGITEVVAPLLSPRVEAREEQFVNSSNFVPQLSLQDANVGAESPWGVKHEEPCSDDCVSTFQSISNAVRSGRGRDVNDTDREVSFRSSGGDHKFGEVETARIDLRQDTFVDFCSRRSERANNCINLSKLKKRTSL